MPALFALLPVWLALAPPPAPAPAPTPTVAAASEHYRLANGLEVILRRDTRLPLAAVHVRYHVGAIDDPPTRRGLAHVVEHLMFEGSRHIDAEARELARARAAIHHDNAETDLHSSEYYTLAPRGSLAVVLWLESDRMGFLRGHAGVATLDRVRAIVAQERRQRRETDPRGARLERLFAALFPPAHPYHDTVIGPHAAIAAIRLADVDAFLAAHYTPQNATLTLVGDLPPDTRALISRHFADLPGAPPVPKTSPIASASPVPSATLPAASPSASPVPSATSPATSASASPVPSATSPAASASASPAASPRPRPPLPAPISRSPALIRVPGGGPPGALCGWPSPGLHADGDAALDVLFAALAAGAFLRLADADAAQLAGFDAQQLSHAGQSVAVAELLARPGLDPAALLPILDRVLARVVAGELDEAELRRARLRLATAQRAAGQELLTRAALLSGYAAAFGDPDALERDLQQWLTVSAADVAAAARSLQTGPRAVVLTTSDLSPKPGAPRVP